MTYWSDGYMMGYRGGIDFFSGVILLATALFFAIWFWSEMLRKKEIKS